MTFTSITFVLFLAVVFAVYWRLTTVRRQNVLLVLASFFFYGWWDYRFCGLMLLSSLIDYYGGRAIHRSNRLQTKRWLLAGVLSCNLALLGFFKYFGFFAENLQALAAAVGWSLDSITLGVVLPVGISFYTFQTMSYTIDIYRGHLQPGRSIVDYLAFVTFFPQLVAGPIERATDLLPQIESPRRFVEADAVDGCRYILWGFFKKMVLADRLAPIVNQHYAAPEQFNGSVLAFATVCFAFQIYCDFSAYSDIAVGTARLFGIRLMRNFAYPYFSRSPAEFWRRWHISLSSWFRDYVYIPLGGSRQGRVKGARNLLITFVVSGFWHGAAWTYLAWGALSGMAVLPLSVARAGRRAKGAGLDQTPGGDRLVPSVSTLACMASTFAFVCFTWIFFRAQTMGQAACIVRTIAVDMFDPAAYRRLFETTGASEAAAWVALFVLVEWVQRRQPHPLHLPHWPRAIRWCLYSLVFWITLHKGTHGSSQFIYFQF
jgi:alginate O-acetyltransferase complex protein AlgI